MCFLSEPSPAPIIRLVDIAPNGYNFLIRGFLSSTYTLDQWDIAGDIRVACSRYKGGGEISLVGICIWLDELWNGDEYVSFSSRCRDGR